MKIDSYSFGRIVLQGTVFTSDVIIYPGRVDAAWWRKEGHLLQVEDLAEALRMKPGVLVIGTGYYGILRVPRETVERIAASGIDVKVEKTARAVEVYNELERAGNVVAALHLTCWSQRPAGSDRRLLLCDLRVPCERHAARSM